MIKVFNLILLILVLVFFFFTLSYYLSSKNIDLKNFNRNNINKIIKEKITNLPTLKNDTKDVIKFNDGYSNEIKDEKSRSFWNLLKSK